MAIFLALPSESYEINQNQTWHKFVPQTLISPTQGAERPCAINIKRRPIQENAFWGFVVMCPLLGRLFPETRR